MSVSILKPTNQAKLVYLSGGTVTVNKNAVAQFGSAFIDNPYPFAPIVLAYGYMGTDDSKLFKLPYFNMQSSGTDGGELLYKVYMNSRADTYGFVAIINANQVPGGYDTALTCTINYYLFKEDGLA